MTSITRIASTFVLIASAAAATSALAQTANSNQPAPDAGATSPSKMSGADKGANKGDANGKTLMQQREKGMAPDAASGGKSTGKMTQ